MDFYSPGCLKNYCECYEAKIPCTVTYFCSPLVLKCLILIMNAFRITASAWVARTWTTGEEELDQAARQQIIRLQEASRLRKARQVRRELLGKGSTWVRGGSSQAQASAQNSCKRPRLWTAMTKVRKDIFVQLFHWNISNRTGRCKAAVFFCQSRGGGGDLPVPLGSGRGGGEEGEEHRADREDRPRGVRPLPRADHRLCGQGQKELTDCERTMQAHPITLQDYIYLLLCWWNVYIKYMFNAIMSSGRSVSTFFWLGRLQAFCNLSSPLIQLMIERRNVGRLKTWGRVALFQSATKLVVAQCQIFWGTAQGPSHPLIEGHLDFSRCNGWWDLLLQGWLLHTFSHLSWNFSCIWYVSVASAAFNYSDTVEEIRRYAPTKV